MSGTALSPWGFIENPDSQAKELANDLGCPIENTTVMVACLKDLDANTITVKRNNFNIFSPSHIMRFLLIKFLASPFWIYCELSLNIYSFKHKLIKI